MSGKKSGARGSLKESGFAMMADIEMLPSFENFTAFPIIFRIICISLFSSPTAYSGKSDERLNVTNNLFTDATGFIKFRT